MTPLSWLDSVGWRGLDWSGGAVNEEMFFVVESPPTFDSLSLLLPCDKLISTTLEMRGERGERGTLADLNFAQLLLFGPRFVDLPLLASCFPLFGPPNEEKSPRTGLRVAGLAVGGCAERKRALGSPDGAIYHGKEQEGWRGLW